MREKKKDTDFGDSHKLRKIKNSIFKASAFFLYLRATMGLFKGSYE
jgi:hypothetical protein